MFAQGGGHFHVVIVEGHNPIERAGARHVAHGIDHVLLVKQRGHVEDFVELIARPIGVAQSLDGEQIDVAALPFGLAHEGLTFFVAGDAEDGAVW